MYLNHLNLPTCFKPIYKQTNECCPWNQVFELGSCMRVFQMPYSNKLNKENHVGENSRKLESGLTLCPMAYCDKINKHYK